MPAEVDSGPQLVSGLHRNRIGGALVGRPGAQRLRWLGREDGWLLILDNADTPALVKPFLPRVCRGHVLITSRAQVFQELGIVEPLHLWKLPPDEAEAFLLKRCPGDADRGAAKRLAAALDHLPLARRSPPAQRC